MEREFKIKTKSQPDPSNQYPSERRYSASIVFGLSLMLLVWGLVAILLASLVIKNISLLRQDEDEKRLADKLQRDLEYSSDQTYLHYYINVPALVCAGCFLMAFGDALGFITGMMAWKRWYIDHNITFFFLSCCFSMLAAFVSLVISVMVTSNIEFDQYNDGDDNIKGMSPISRPVAINIIATSLSNCVWSYVSAKVGYMGMRNSYPDDIVIKGGRVEVSTIKKGNQNNVISNIPIEVINNFAVEKIAKYLPKIENTTCNLAKEESNAEYRLRVDKFLNAQPEEGEPENEGKQTPPKQAEVKPNKA